VRFGRVGGGLAITSTETSAVKMAA
jgi:hypothetical protein